MIIAAYTITHNNNKANNILEAKYVIKQKTWWIKLSGVTLNKINQFNNTVDCYNRLYKRSIRCLKIEYIWEYL